MAKSIYFTKGRRCGVPGAGRKKSEKTLLKEKKEWEEQIAKEKAYFEEFINSSEGVFDGFRMVEIFHQKINKSDAICRAFADDSADVTFHGRTYHVGEDGIICYFFSEKPTKQVIFNRSVYFF